MMKVLLLDRRKIQPSHVDVWTQYGDARLDRDMMKNLVKEAFNVNNKQVQGDSFNSIYMMA